MILKSTILNRKSKLGFTLIEILVVISIIGILATLILARLGGVEKSARDARRKSDLNQYRTALENYAIKTNGLYPSFTSTVDASGSVCSALGSQYISTCPTDPRQDGVTYYYQYQSDGSGSGTKYDCICHENPDSGCGTYTAASGMTVAQCNSQCPVACLNDGCTPYNECLAVISGSADATQYVLWATNETGSDSWVLCSDGRVGKLSPVSVSGGICPLP